MDISTPRLTLKAITPALIHELYETKSKAEIMEFFGFGEKDYDLFNSNHKQGMETARISLFFFLLVRKDNGQPIGQCGFHTWDRKHHRAELFYLLHREEDKRLGFMKEALPVVLNHGFSVLHLHRIEALIAAENEASLRLVHSLGFIREGTKRQDYWLDGMPEDSELYALLAVDNGARFLAE